MPTPYSRLDPKGFYAVLGLDPAATPEAVTAAFRRRAREVHPDVVGTGDASAFVAAKQAYDVLSNRSRRANYDHAARQAAASAAQDPVVQPADAGASGTGAPGAGGPGWGGPNRRGGIWPAFKPGRRPERATAGGSAAQDRAAQDRAAWFIRQTWIPEVPLPVWIGLAAFLCLCVFEAALHLRSPPPVANAGIRPNAAPVAPISAGEQRAMLFGPNPVRLAGASNAYVVPAAGATVLWHKDTGRDALVPVGQLPPFSTVHAVRLYRTSGLVEVTVNETSNGFIEAKRLAPGDAEAARRAYCGYNAGRSPYDGERLQQRAKGSGTIQLENRALQPAVVKLRDASGAVVLSVFLGPAGHIDLADVPEGTFRADFAIGELWSRACNGFAAGMRARRLVGEVATARDARLVVNPEQEAGSAAISDEAFESDAAPEAGPSAGPDGARSQPSRDDGRPRTVP